MPHTTTYRNVIFDLDGTLIDSKPGILGGIRHTLNQLGHDLPTDHALDWTIGPPLGEVMTRLLAEFGDSRVDQAVACYRAWYGTIGLFDALPYGGVPELLDTLTEAGKCLFLGTAKRTGFALTMLEHLGLAHRFRAIYGTEPHGRFDRKTDLLGYILRTEGLDPATTVVVGDREHDVMAARAHGLPIIAVT